MRVSYRNNRWKIRWTLTLSCTNSASCHIPYRSTKKAIFVYIQYITFLGPFSRFVLSALGISNFLLAFFAILRNCSQKLNLSSNHRPRDFRLRLIFTSTSPSRNIGGMNLRRLVNSTASIFTAVGTSLYKKSASLCLAIRRKCFISGTFLG